MDCKKNVWTFRGIHAGSWATFKIQTGEKFRMYWGGRTVLFTYTVFAEVKKCFQYIGFLRSCDNSFHHAPCLRVLHFCKRPHKLNKTKLFFFSFFIRLDCFWTVNCVSRQGDHRGLHFPPSKLSSLQCSCFESVVATQRKCSLVLTSHNNKQTRLGT